VTFLTVPIIVFEDLGPIAALKRSGHLLKQTWGENLMAQIGLGLIGLVAFLPGIIVGGLGIVAGDMLITIPLVAVGAVLLAVAASIVSALSGIYRTALYRFAVDGQVPEAFATTDLPHAFGKRKNVGSGFGSRSGGGFAGTSNN
jgi:hypothetical protein